MGALYRLDFPSGKSYIGITMGSVESRFRAHVLESTKRKGWAVHRAIAKYGVEAVKVVTLAISDSWGYLQLVEKNAIRVFGTFGEGGYNMTAGGDGTQGHVVSEEERAKRSARSRGRKMPPEHVARMKGNTHAVGYVNTPEQIAAWRRSMLGSASGVSFCKQTNRWKAQISVGRRTINLGRFINKADAQAARAAAVQKRLAGEPL